MGWVVADPASAQGHFASATDGDMDIAYALILAHYQWGSSGSIITLLKQKGSSMMDLNKATSLPGID